MMSTSSYARFDKMAADLSSSEDEDGCDSWAHEAPRMPDAHPMAGGPFERVKTECMELMGATDVASRDAALRGIAAEFTSLDRSTAAGLVKFALLPIMLLLRSADSQQPVSSGPPMAVHKQRAIELALAAMGAVVKTGGVSGDEVSSLISFVSSFPRFFC